MINIGTIGMSAPRDLFMLSHATWLDLHINATSVSACLAHQATTECKLAWWIISLSSVNKESYQLFRWDLVWMVLSNPSGWIPPGSIEKKLTASGRIRNQLLSKIVR